MVGKLGIILVILILVFTFYLVISIGAGKFSKGEIIAEGYRSKLVEHTVGDICQNTRIHPKLLDICCMWPA